MGCWLCGWIEHYLEMNLTVFVTIYCFLVLTFNFTFFRGIAQSLTLCMQLGNPLANVPKATGNSLANFF
jgi:hypothetical protein